MRIVAAALAAFFICAAGAAAAPASERMPALFKYEKADEGYFPCPAASIRVVLYNDIGGADSPNFKAVVIYINEEPRAVLIYLADDSWAEETEWTAFIDLNRDAVVDRTERLAVENLGPDHACAIVAEALGATR